MTLIYPHQTQRAPQRLSAAVSASAHPLLWLEQRRRHLQQSHARGQEGLQAGVGPGRRRRRALRHFVPQSGGNARVEPEHPANQGEPGRRRRLTATQTPTLTAPGRLCLCVPTQVLKHVGAETVVTHEVSAPTAGSLIGQRDFVCVRHSRKHKSHVYLSGAAVQMESFPPLAGFVR